MEDFRISLEGPAAVCATSTSRSLLALRRPLLVGAAAVLRSQRWRGDDLGRGAAAGDGGATADRAAWRHVANPLGVPRAGAGRVARGAPERSG